MKKFITIIISILLLMGISSMAFADEPYSEGKLYYTINDGSVTIVGSFGSDEVITVPASIAGYPVNTIATGAFTGRTHLKTLNLPDTITTIEEGALPSNITVVYNSDASKSSGSGGGDSGSSGTGDATSSGDGTDAVDKSNSSEYVISKSNTDSDGNPLPDSLEVDADEARDGQSANEADKSDDDSTDSNISAKKSGSANESDSDGDVAENTDSTVGNESGEQHSSSVIIWIIVAVVVVFAVILIIRKKKK